MLTLPDMLCVKDFHQKERNSTRAFTNGFDGLLSRTDGPVICVSPSLQPVTLRGVIQLPDLVFVPMRDGFNFIV